MLDCLTSSVSYHEESQNMPFVVYYVQLLTPSLIYMKLKATTSTNEVYSRSQFANRTSFFILNAERTMRFSIVVWPALAYRKVSVIAPELTLLPQDASRFFLLFYHPYRKITIRCTRQESEAFG
jgi:hypothetical protein